MGVSKSMKRILTSSPFHDVLYRFVRAYSATFSLSVTNEKAWMEHVAAGGRVILCTWHQQFFAAISHFKNYQRFSPSLMISKSMDGSIIAGVARRCGWHTVAGSSSKGGAEALKEMIGSVRKNGLAGHVVDGPRGPAGRVKPGLIRMAHEAGACVVPFFAEASSAWFFDSWDNFMLPKPFARVRLVFLDMVSLAPTTDRDEFERQRLAVEEAMRPHLKGRLSGPGA